MDTLLCIDEVVLCQYIINERNDPKFSDRYAWTNSADPDQEQSDQGLHCLSFRLHRLDLLLYGRATKFKFYSDYNKCFGCPNI